MGNLKKLKLGIIGASEGNGHPYSWSAIFNGYSKSEMSKCPFPVIFEYLEKQNFPDDFLSNVAVVTHIWTQDVNESTKIAKASNIENICDDLNDLIESVDAVLLARDDAENHFKYAKPVLDLGKPIYIDKPFAIKKNDALKIWNSSKFENQIYSCSALQFADELKLSNLDLKKIGDIKLILATTPKSWTKYSVHIIEPILNLIPNRGKLISINSIGDNSKDENTVKIKWESNIEAILQSTGNLPSPIWIRVIGNKNYKDLIFTDSFNAFKNSLYKFINIISGNEKNISREFTLEMVEIIEKGYE